MDADDRSTDRAGDREAGLATATTSADSAMAKRIRDVTVPLTGAERMAYRGIDSTLTMERAFQPRGLIGRRARLNAGPEDTTSARRAAPSFRPELVYNRVEGLGAGLGFSIRVGRFRAGTSGRYATAAAEWSYAGDLEAAVHRDLAVFVRGGDVIRPNDTPGIMPVLFNSVTTLAGRTDYFDYHRRRAAAAGVRLDRGPVRIALSAGGSSYASVRRNTDYDLFRRSPHQPPNPGIYEGRLGTVAGRLTAGPDFGSGVSQPRRIVLEVLRAEKGLFGGDLEFTRFSGRLDWRFPTLLGRRLLPAVLDVSVFGATHRGPVPRQLLSAIASGPYRFGMLRTGGSRPFYGDRTAAVFWEHNFRTLPFELVGADLLVENGLSLLVFGGHARTWLGSESAALTQNTDPMAGTGPTPVVRTTGGPHHEVGVGLAGILGLLQVTYALRMDRADHAFGVGIARIF